jgi:hypothetical protein
MVVAQVIELHGVATEKHRGKTRKCQHLLCSQAKKLLFYVTLSRKKFLNVNTA